jgi:hypothetical protein
MKLAVRLLTLAVVLAVVLALAAAAARAAAPHGSWGTRPDRSRGVAPPPSPFPQFGAPVKAGYVDGLGYCRTWLLTSRRALLTVRACVVVADPGKAS